MLRYRSTALVLMAALLASCGGGGSTSTLPKTTGGTGTQNVALTINFPAHNGTQAKNGRRPDYLPVGAAGIGVDFGPNPQTYTNTANTTPMYAQAIALNSAAAPGCPASAQPDGSYTCTIYLAGVPVGYDDFRITIWNAAPAGCTNVAGYGSGCNFTSDTALSTTVIPFQAVKQGQTNVFSFGFASTVDSVYVAVDSGIVDGAVSTVTAYVIAKDAGGQVILNSSQFYGKNNLPLTINLSITHDLGAGGCTDNTSGTPCSLYFNQATDPAFTSVGPSGNSVVIQYDGTQQFPSNSSSQPALAVSFTGDTIAGSTLGSAIAVTQSNGSGIGASGAPQIKQVAALTSPPVEMAMGSDGNLYVTEYQSYDKVSTGGSVANTVATGVGVHLLQAVGGLADGDVWMFDGDTTTVRFMRFAPGGSPSYAGFNAQGFFPTIANVVMAANGLAYFADSTNSTLDSINPNNFAAGQTYQAAGTPVGWVTNGPTLANGHPTVCAASSSLVECYDTTATTFGTSQAPTAAANAVVLGSDNRLYVAENGDIDIFTVDTAGNTGNVGAFTHYATAANVTAIAAGNDGNVWFVESNGDIGKITPSSSSPSMQEYATGVTVNGFSAPTSPNTLVAGTPPSTTLYFTDNVSNEVYSITP